jgi:hypothetical protein
VAYEDFTTYTEVDGDSEITVTTDKVLGVNLTRGNTAYVYKDKGASFFDSSFIQEFQINTGTTTGASLVGLWGVGNVIKDLYAISTSGTPGDNEISLYAFNAGADVRLRECVDGAFVSAGDTVALSDATDYYVRVTYDSSVGTYGTVYAWFWSDAFDGTLAGSLELALTAAIDFRYQYALQAYDSGGHILINDGIYIKNLAITSSDPAAKAWTFNPFTGRLDYFDGGGCVFVEKLSGFTIEGGTISKTLTVDDDLTVSDLHDHITYSSGTVGMPLGSLTVGVSDTTQGVLSLMGDSATAGGALRLMNGANVDDPTDYWELSPNTSGDLVIATDDNVWITVDALAGKLDVQNSLRIKSNGIWSSGDGLELLYNGTKGSILAYDRTGAAYKAVQISGLSVDITNSGTSRIYVKSDGYVGISNSNPQVGLDVKGNHVAGTGIGRFTGLAATGYLSLDTTTGGAGDSSGFLLKLGGTLVGQFGAEAPNDNVVIKNRQYADKVMYQLDTSGVTSIGDVAASKEVTVDTNGNIGMKAAATVDGVDVSQLKTDFDDSIGGGTYVNRGDPSSVDYSSGSFTKDGTWYDLDLSSIVGAQRVLVHMRVVLSNDTVEEYLSIRENGNSNSIASFVGRATVADKDCEFADAWVMTDSSGVVEYAASNGGTWNKMNVSVRGWTVYDQAASEFAYRGDPAGADFTVGNFTTDGSWHDLDLSSIVPAGANTVRFRITIQDGSTNQVVKFRKNGQTNQVNRSEIRTQVVNLDHAQDMEIHLDENRIIEYQTSNTTFTKITLVVQGWTLSTSGTGRFVDRGDPSGSDFSLGDLTTDGTWRDLDLSGILPAGASAVKMICVIEDDAANNAILFRKNGLSNELNRSECRTQVSGIDVAYDITVPVDGSGVIEYNATNTTWTRIDIIVKGWYT